MASTNETTKTVNKTELSTAQIQTLVKATGMNEDEIRQTYGQFMIFTIFLRIIQTILF